MWLSLGDTVWCVWCWREIAEWRGRDTDSPVYPRCTGRGSYTHIRASISTCEVSLSGGCLSISGSCVLRLRAMSGPASEDLLWQGGGLLEN